MVSQIHGNVHVFIDFVLFFLLTSTLIGYIIKDLLTNTMCRSSIRLIIMYKMIYDCLIKVHRPVCIAYFHVLF